MSYDHFGCTVCKPPAETTHRFDDNFCLREVITLILTEIITNFIITVFVCIESELSVFII